MVTLLQSAYIRAAMAFDTLSYARRLRQAGVPEQQAEAMADATRELVMQDVASKSDLTGAEQRLKAEIAALEQRLMAAMETLSLRLTVRIGVMLAAGLSLMTALIGLIIRAH
jgi:hypothetical protein